MAAMVAIAVDGAGNAYVTGSTLSSDFPTTPGAFEPGGGSDAFVTKVNAAGSALVYSTFLGGSAGDEGLDIAVDGDRNAYVTGRTFSTDFPTANPLQPANAGGLGDVFITKVTAAGSALVYSTYLGGGDLDRGSGIAVDGAGNAYMTGETKSTDFPTANPLQATFGGGRDRFVAKLNAAGSALVYSTYLGDSGFEEGRGIAVDGAGNAYVTGRGGALVTKLNAAGSALVYSTFLGGGIGHAIAVDAAGNAYVTGETSSTDFPTTPGAFQPSCATPFGVCGDAFVAKIADIGTDVIINPVPWLKLLLLDD